MFRSDVEEASLINEAVELRFQRRSTSLTSLRRWRPWTLPGVFVGALCIGAFAMHRLQIMTMGSGDDSIEKVSNPMTNVGFRVVYSGKICDEAPLSDVPHDTVEQCQAACGAGCGFIFFKNDPIAKVPKVCKTFATCNKTKSDSDGYSKVMKRLPTCVAQGLLSPALAATVGFVYRSVKGETVGQLCLTQGDVRYGIQAMTKSCGGTLPLRGDTGNTAIGLHMSQTTCEDACDQDPACNFYKYKNQVGTVNQYTCALYSSCDNLVPPVDGIGEAIFIKPSMLAGYTLILYDMYCKGPTGNPVEIKHQASDRSPLQALSNLRCKQLCDAEPACNFYLFKDDKWAKVHRECVTFSSCEQQVSFLDFGHSVVYQKIRASVPLLLPVAATPPPSPTAPPTLAPTAAPKIHVAKTPEMKKLPPAPLHPDAGKCDLVTIMNVSWCKTVNWDCAGCDRSEHEVSANPIKTMKTCLLACLMDHECVAMNMGRPGDGYCYMKGPVHGCGEDERRNMKEHKCGMPTAGWDYYTLVTPRNEINVLKLIRQITI